MKIFFVSTCAFACAAMLWACGGTETSEDGTTFTCTEPDGTPCPDSSGNEGVSRDAGSSNDGGAHSPSSPALGDDAGSVSNPVVSNDDGGSGSSSGGGDALCGPGNTCGGLYYCTDPCYSSKCCALQCNCSDPTGQTGTMECLLDNCKN
jgi:hypothetical protein